MSFDLAGAKTRLNITGTAQDVEIQAALNASLAIAEAYCKRKFSFAAEVAHYYHVSAGYLFVDRYPINAVTSVVRNNGQSDIKYKVNKSAGFLDLHGRYSDEEIQVTYSGGYATLPDDLIIALWGIFDGVWASSQGISGPSAGAIESVSLTGVGTVRMDTGGASAGAAASAAIPAMASAILSAYRREMA
jgi:hypothetical protein